MNDMDNEALILEINYINFLIQQSYINLHMLYGCSEGESVLIKFASGAIFYRVYTCIRSRDGLNFSLRYK